MSTYKIMRRRSALVCAGPHRGSIGRFLPTLALACLLVVPLATETSAQANGPKPLTKDILVRLATDSIFGKNPDWIINEWVRKLRIGFLPTRAVRAELIAAGVPDKVVASLPRQFAEKAEIRVFEFDCTRCTDSPFDRAMALEVHHALAAERAIINNDLRDILYGKGLNPEVHRRGIGSDGRKIPFIGVDGHVSTTGNRRVLRVTATFENGPDVQATIAAPFAVDLVGADLALPAKAVAAWLIDVLRSSLSM